MTLYNSALLSASKPLWCSCWNKAKARGEIDVEDTSVNAACFLGSVMGYLLPATLISKELPDKQLLDAIAHNSVAVFLTAWHYRHL